MHPETWLENQKVAMPQSPKKSPLVKSAAKSSTKKSAKTSPQSSQNLSKLSVQRRKSSKATAAKQKYVQSLIQSDATITMSAAGQQVIKKFGTMLAFDKLREAFLSGGGKLSKRGRPSKFASRKNVASKPQVASPSTTARTSSVARKPARIQNVASPGEKSSIMHRARSIGRRSADVQAAAINKTFHTLPTHMVVTLQGSQNIPQTFATQKQAQAHIQKLLEQGLVPSQIAYYERKPMGVSIRI